jgi:hypothetical protein
MHEVEMLVRQKNRRLKQTYSLAERLEETNEYLLEMEFRTDFQMQSAMI